jgi:hypothetical protein
VLSWNEALSAHISHADLSLLTCFIKDLSVQPLPPKAPFRQVFLVHLSLPSLIPTLLIICLCRRTPTHLRIKGLVEENWEVRWSGLSGGQAYREVIFRCIRRSPRGGSIVSGPSNSTKVIDSWDIWVVFKKYLLFMMLEPISDGALDGVCAGMLDGVFDGRHRSPNINWLLSKYFKGLLDEALDGGHRHISTGVKVLGRCLGTEWSRVTLARPRKVWTRKKPLDVDPLTSG